MRQRGHSLLVVTCSTCSLSSLQGLKSLMACICIFMTQLKPKELGLQEKKKDKKTQLPKHANRQYTHSSVSKSVAYNKLDSVETNSIL